MHPKTAGTTGVRLCFHPKAARFFHFTIRSNVPVLGGKTAAITAYAPEADVAQHPISLHPNLQPPHRH
ncbi:MAG: hypothetical protein AAF702_49365 [Chloroflexota bacterium]